MPVWDPLLPYVPLRDGHKETPLDKPDVTSMEDGPTRMRQWGDINGIVQPVAFALRSLEQVRRARAFLTTTLNRRTSQFEMPVKLLGETGYTVRTCEVKDGDFELVPWGAIHKLSFTRVVYL